MFEEFKRPINQAKDEIVNYINFKVRYLELKLQREVTNFAFHLISNAILWLFVGMILLMLSLAFVFWFGRYIGGLYVGFLLVAGFYFVLGLLIFLNRKKWFLRPLEKKWIQNMKGDFKSMEDLPMPKNMADVDDWLEIINLKAEQSKLSVEEAFEDFFAMLTPKSILQKLMFSISIHVNPFELMLKGIRGFFSRRRDNAV
jgi:Protein of unknown function (DUF1469).